MKSSIQPSIFAVAILATIAATGCQASTRDTPEEGDVGTAAQPLTTLYSVVNVNSKKAFNIFGTGRKEYYPLIQWADDGSSNEAFVFTQTPDSHYTITAPFSGLCLDLRDGLASAGQGIDQRTCNGGDSQKFAVQYVAAPATYRIMPKSSGMCLQVFDESTANGYAVVQAPCAAASLSQQWQVIVR